MAPSPSGYFALDTGGILKPTQRGELSHYTKVDGTTIMVGAENSSQVYEYLLDTPLAFQEGGYFQPTGNISEINVWLEDLRRLTSYYMGVGIDDLLPPATGDLFTLEMDSRYPVIAVRTGKSILECSVNNFGK